MTQRNIKIIMAAIALGAPMMASGFVQAAPYSPRYLSPAGHGFANGVTNVACQWVRDYRGNVYCLELPNDQSYHTSPGR